MLLPTYTFSKKERRMLIGSSRKVCQDKTVSTVAPYNRRGSVMAFQGSKLESIIAKKFDNKYYSGLLKRENEMTGMAV